MMVSLISEQVLTQTYSRLFKTLECLSIEIQKVYNTNNVSKMDVLMARLTSRVDTNQYIYLPRYPNILSFEI